MAERRIFYRHFDLPAGFPVIGLLGPTWLGEHQEEFRLHFHNCLEIGLMYRGEAVFYLNDEEIRLQAPCITVAPPRAPHIMNAAEGVVCGWKWLYVDPVRLLPHLPPRTAAALGMYQYRMQGSECVLRPDREPELCDMIGLIVRLMEKARGDWQGAVRELFGAFFLMLLSGHPLSGKTVHSDRYESILDPAIACILEEYMHDLSVHDLAMRCHLSDTHFRRVFKRIYGWAPLDYIHTIRMERACTLLFDGEKTVGEIANAVGYASPSSFTRHFEEVYGMSPSQWRRRMTGEENEVVSRYFHSLPPAAQKFFPEEYLQQLGSLDPFGDGCTSKEDKT